MNLESLLSHNATIGFGLYAFIFLSCLWLMKNRNYLVLLVWPILIYFCGPLFTEIFADTPVLSRYVFPEYTLAETLLIFMYYIVLLICDRVLGLSEIIEASVAHPRMKSLAHSPLFFPVFLLTASIAVVLQTKLLVEFGSVFTGNYVLLGVDDGSIPFWGFLAGLYEAIFLLFILFIISTDHSLRSRFFVIGLYLVTSLLRVAGGTRLILVKELAFVVILFYLQNRLKTKYLFLTVSIVVAIGSLVGILRMKEISEQAAFLGPLFGFVMESALDSLTLNIAYFVQASGYVAEHADWLQTLAFLINSAIPSFARFSLSADELAAMSPYNEALHFGFDTFSPVGGMSGFATLCYMFSYPVAAVSVLAIMISLVFRYFPAGNFKRIMVLVFLLNAVHFWRDPVDMAVKQVAQDAVLALILLAGLSLRLSVPTPLLDEIHQPRERHC